MSGDITISEEPVPETPAIDLGSNSSVGDVMDNVSNIISGNQNGGNGTSNYTGSINNILDNAGNQLGPNGELSYENSPNGELLEDENLIGNSTGKDRDSLDVISIDQGNDSSSASTDSGGSSVVPAVLGVGAAGAAAVAGIHFIKNKKDEENGYYEDENNENDDTNENNSFNTISQSTDDMIYNDNENNDISFGNSKYKAGTVNQLQLDDGKNIVIEDDYDVIKPQNEELE